MKLVNILIGWTTAQWASQALAAPSPVRRAGFGTYADDMFTTAIEWNDGYWDDEAGYLIAAASNPGRYDARHTAWYATQLLARNAPGDVARAIRIFDNVIAGQYLDPSKQWYGDYQQSPSEPEPGTAEYPDDGPYSSWDPNIRDFVGCAWLMALNDYDHLLPQKTVSKIEQSLHIAAKGDLYRVGGVDGDNLYPCYSNPWIMRTILQNWVGTRVGDANLTQSGEKFAQELYDLWSMHHTLSEFNSPTYSGVAMWALALWSHWNELAGLYNANLKNLAGPWDRTYGYDMKQYASLVGAVIWGAVGRDHAPIPQQTSGMYHGDDFAFYPLFAMVMPEMLKYLSAESKASLVKFSEPRLYTAQAFSPPFDTYPRNITTWLSENITIGAETVAQEVIGGAAKSTSAFSPAVIQWAIDEYQIGCISHWVTESSIDAVASSNGLKISYPNATSSDASVSFNFLFSGLSRRNGFNVTGLEGLPALDLRVKTNAFENYTIVYDTDQSVNDFIFYNITYTVPAGLAETPFISLELV
ncbi:hypothetical protein N7468_006833 [Penicillium chermesinum]|uniref:Uncharacterized protein n=1 Tax=Penicillium chermesinum TaxID=63820 RepID=A0A9W9NVD5_9EURO|nr:uncharacterized protein N7468_006833 [Penicillium chermesinum]KAJ5225608.1 hypothetical protein N7468_006833 [Penicillium chermesinum]KAJ6161172.1 hypothetical protein N7470_004568 [Penicillium chermesinum]